MGAMCPPYYGKSKYYAWRKKLAVKRIAKEQAVIKKCDEKIAEKQKQD